MKDRKDCVFAGQSAAKPDDSDVVVPGKWLLSQGLSLESTLVLMFECFHFVYESGRMLRLSCSSSLIHAPHLSL